MWFPILSFFTLAYAERPLPPGVQVTFSADELNGILICCVCGPVKDSAFLLCILNRSVAISDKPECSYNVHSYDIKE